MSTMVAGTRAITVGVYATDPLTRQGAKALLSSYPGLVEVDALDGQHCEVLLVLCAELTDGVLSVMRRICVAAAGRELAIVVIANVVQEQQVMRAVRFGMVSLLFRAETNFGQIAEAILAAKSGRARLPGAVQRHLIDQIRRPDREAPTAPSSGLTTRELAVLRMLADGMDTNEVAVKLSYSDRTVKNIVHAMVTRLGLRNRTHAVAYALRKGIL
jgi:DNA-binding NarL/FixJ family response regulator